MRIIIIEDEIKVRDGLGKLIESQTSHIVIGKASNGEDGLAMILRFKPDLVITDIRMPKMDGLEMIQYMNEHKIAVHVVILSGYSEFDYAKRAITYGVDDYLLKPLAIEDVQNMLAKIEEKIHKEQLTGQTAETYFKNLIMEKEDGQEKNYEILKSIYRFPEEVAYELFMGYIGSTPFSYREEMEQAFEKLKSKYHEIRFCIVILDNSQKVYLLVQQEIKENRLEELEKSFYHRMILHDLAKKERAVWTKKRFQRLMELKSIIGELEKRMASALVITYKDWLTEEDIKNYEVKPYIDPVNIINRLRNALCQEDWEKLKTEAEKFLQYMQGGFRAKDIRRAMIRNYHFMRDTVQEMNPSIYHYLKDESHLSGIETAVTWGEMEKAYRDVIDTITSSKVNKESIGNYLIKKAINYIREHYQEGVTQEELARKLAITPEYLSTLFNREMGINFSTFLKQFRISHAKRLLKGTDMKVYEIAQAVGYSDSKYFQRVFKDVMGISPGDYRQMS